MQKEDFEHLERSLREISLFLAEIKAREGWKIEEKKKASLRSLFYLVGGKNDPNRLPELAPMRDTVDLKLNSLKAKEKGVSKNQKEGELEMLINVGGVSINSKPRKDGRYQGYIVNENGKTYVYGRTYQDVVVKLNYLYNHGTPKKKVKALATVNGVPITFNAFARYYFANFREKKVATATYKTDLMRYNKYIAPVFKEKPLKTITPVECQKILESLTSAGKGKTADEVYCLLSVIFKMAIKHGILARNPLDIVYHEKHERKHGSALTVEEERTLKERFSADIPFLMVALYTGLRPNEYQTARIEGDFIIAVNSKRKHKRIEYKKIPIIKALKPFLENGLPAVPPLYEMRKAFKQVFPARKLYDLRTTFYSRCKEFGVAEPALNHFVGHSNGVLASAYTHLSDKYLLTEGKKLDFWGV